VQVLRALDPACDEEAVKLVKTMPAWSPGKQGDKTVRVRMTLPIVFKLDN
jgi:periplasmic protein TonB